MKVKNLVSLCLTLVLLGVFSPVFSQSGEELIAESDTLYADMQDMATAQKVLSLCRRASGVMENRYEAFWRMARIMYFIGFHTEKKKDKKKVFDQGVYYAERAVELNPDKPDGYYWLAVNNGKVGETRGVLKSLSLVKPIKRALQKVIDIDRSYEQAGADMVYGRVYYKVPGIAGGSKDKSLEHLLKAKEIAPDNALTRLYLAETMLSKKMKEEAKAELEFILGLPDDPRWILQRPRCKAEARDLLEKKFK